jgi:raffinose/stachyose/melibiose transport system substrate-binding protein
LTRHWILSLGLGAALTWAVPGEAATVKWFIAETNANQTAWMREVAKAYEAANPGTTIAIEVMAAEPYKGKLTTMLQSRDRPDLIYSWGGGVLHAQVEAGFLKDISADMKGAWAGTFGPAAVEAMSYKGKVYGAPVQITVSGLWYNKALLAKANFDPARLSTWDGLLEAVKTLKAAGITPFAVGGADKWPLNQYWAQIALRVGGRQAFENAMNRTGPGFDGPDIVQTSQLYRQFVDLEPFQKGFLGDTGPQAAGQFGDGKAAMAVIGNWHYALQKNQSAQKGQPDDNIGWMPFPTVSGGKGDPTDLLSGINGFLVTRDAPPEAVAFLRHYTSVEVQSDAARRGFFIPVAKGAEKALANPFFRDMAVRVQGAAYLQNYWDQMLGPQAGRVVNDASTDLASGRISAVEMGKAIQQAWDLER